MPGGKQMLVAHGSRVDGRFKRSFEVVKLDDLGIDKRASPPQYLQLFSRWQDPVWKRQTLSLR